MADLSAAAAAVDADAPEVASDVVEADRSELTRFEQQALARLLAGETTSGGHDVGPAGPTRRRSVGRSRLLPVAPLVAAAGVAFAVAMGAVPATHDHAPAIRAQQVARSWAEFSQLASSDASADQLIAAAERLHDSLATLIRGADGNSAQTREALRLLQLERQMLLRDNPPGTSVVLAQAQELLAQLRSSVSKISIPPSLATAVHVSPTATATPGTSQRVVTANSKSSGTAATPSPSASPSPTPSTAVTTSPAPSPTWDPFPQPHASLG